MTNELKTKDEFMELVYAYVKDCIAGTPIKLKFQAYDNIEAAYAALEAERDALRMTEEAAMRAALRVMSNLEDRRGVLDGVGEDVKKEIADEIAFTIFAAIASKEPK